MRERARKTPEQLRSTRWFAPNNLRSFCCRSRARQLGYACEGPAGRPTIGIVTTWAGSDRGHAPLNRRTMTQAHKGCDFDFLDGALGESPEPGIF